MLCDLSEDGSRDFLGIASPEAKKLDTRVKSTRPKDSGITRARVSP